MMILKTLEELTEYMVEQIPEHQKTWAMVGFLMDAGIKFKHNYVDDSYTWFYVGKEWSTEELYNKLQPMKAFL